MGQLYHRNSSTDSGLGASTAGTPTEVKSAGKSDSLVVLVDDDAGGTPGSYSLDIEVYDEQTDTWFDYDSAAASTDPSQTFDAVGDKMRVTLTNETAGAADFRIVCLTYK